MKVFIDTNVLIDVAVRADQFPDSLKLINDIIEWDEASLWVSAISLNNLEYILSRLGHKEKARNFLKFIQQTFSIIPFRRSVFTSALDSNTPDFEDAIQMSCAESLGANYLITRNSDDFKDSNVPVLTPRQFLEKWNAGEFDICGQVPFLDLKAQHHQIYNEIDDRMTDIIANTGFILGKHVDEFEERFAELQGAKHCIGVSSGTDALHIALLALGIGPGDAVIVPVNTFIATAEAVSLCGVEPVFVNCDRFYNLDVNVLREILTQRAVKLEDEKSRKAEGEKERGIVESRQYAVTSKQGGGGDRGQGSEVGGRKERGEECEKIREILQNTGAKSHKIRAIIPVHLYGQPANMDGIMALAEEYGFAVIEDACQAHLARYRKSDVRWQSVGTTGEFGAFSFYPGKNLGAYGEAGALVTNDEELYIKAKMIRQHGEIERYNHKVIGHNYRMEAIQGAVLATKLKYLDEWTKKRQENARLYNEFLAGVDGIQTPEELEGTDCVYHLYIIQADDRDGLQKYLQEKGVASGLHYPIPLHLQEAYKHLGHKEGDFPVAEKAAGRILSLPMYPELTKAQIHYVCDRVKEFLRR